MTGLANIEAEAAVLGAMMQEHSAIDRAADVLNASDFAEMRHGMLFDIIVGKASKGEAATPVTVAPQWAMVPDAETLGGNAYLMKLTSASDAGFLGFKTMIEQLAELSRRRAMIDGLHEAADMAVNLDTSVEDIISAADAALNGSDRFDGVEQLTAMQCADNLIDTFKQDKSGVTCRTVSQMDDVLGKIRPKELVVLAGRPGMGKTAVALSYALGAAQAGFGVLFVSLEMSGTELAARMIADLCYDGNNGVLYSNIRDGNLSDNQRRRVWAARNMLRDMPLRVVDAGKLTTARLAMLVMRTKRKMEAQGQALDLVIVDYLQLLSPDQATRGMYEKVSEISMALKACAKTYGVGIMALAQLSREVEKRPDKTPQLSDLRDSGQIEQDADAVLFLVRQNYYHQFTKPDSNDPGRALWDIENEQSLHDLDLICAKRRNGETGKATANFYGQFQAVRGRDA